MGHYLSEMYSPLMDSKIKADYQKRCASEIGLVIQENPLEISALDVGDKVRMYKPLFKKSKVGLLHSEKGSETIRDNLYHCGWESWELAFLNLHEKLNLPFEVSDLNVSTEIVRINPIKKTDILPLWKFVKFFQKI